MLSSSHTCTLAFLCTTWIANDSARTPWVSQSKPILLAFTLHHPWSIGMNLSLDLHHMPSTATSHPTPAHHEPKYTSNPHNIVNHSSSKGDHHWSSISPLMSALTTPNANSSCQTKLKEEKDEKEAHPRDRKAKRKGNHKITRNEKSQSPKTRATARRNSDKNT